MIKCFTSTTIISYRAFVTLIWWKGNRCSGNTEFLFWFDCVCVKLFTHFRIFLRMMIVMMMMMMMMMLMIDLASKEIRGQNLVSIDFLCGAYIKDLAIVTMVLSGRWVGRLCICYR